MKKQGNQGNSGSNLILYKASAGSGKTFMLAVEYIALLVKNPSAYKSILAVTFTNKATSEMKERILSKLYGIANDLKDKETQAYLAKVSELVPSMSQTDIRTNCKIAMNNILQDYGHFRVETIDSFFQSILRGLARELQLGATLNLEIDTDKVIADAVKELLAGVDVKSTTGKAVTEFITENIENDKNWSIQKSLEEFSKQLFNETFAEKGNGLKEMIKKDDSITTFRADLAKKLEQLDTNTRADLAGLGKQIKAAIDMHGMNQPGCLQKNTMGVYEKINSASILDKDPTKELNAKFFNHCRNYNDPTGVNSGDTKKLFVSDYLKKNPNLKSEWENDIAGHFQSAYGLITNYITEKNTYEGAIKYLYEVSLLMQIKEIITKQNIEQERFILADTATLLDGLKSGDTSFVFEKTGSFTNHIMIDEFQDTSRLQWKNFYILLLESLSNYNRSLVVGDVKQSIYRWRNSDWNIFNEEVENDFRKYSPSVNNLDTNRRSLDNVIHFNNQLFEHSKQVASDSFKELSGKEHQTLLKAYEGAAQNTSKGYGGYVCVDIARDNSNQDVLEEGMNQKLKRYLDVLTTEKGVKPNEIAILFRKKRHIYSTAKWFTENTDYKMVSSEAFLLNSSAAVRILANTMKWLVDRTDTIALATMLWEWNTAILRKDIQIDAVLQGEKVEDNLPEGLKGQWERLRHLPLYELSERLYSTLQLEKSEADAPYIMAFFDAVTNFIKRNPNDLSLFVDEWDEHISKSAIPISAGDGIRLFTVHKSKGLEFPTVIVPFCNWKLNEEATQFKDSKIWVNTEKTRVNGVPLLPIRYDGHMNNSDFHNDYIEEASLQYVDNLNILYVAFTRAGSNLIALGTTSTKQGEAAANVADLVLNFMEKRSELVDGDVHVEIRNKSRGEQVDGGVQDNKKKRRGEPVDGDVQEDNKDNGLVYEIGQIMNETERKEIEKQKKAEGAGGSESAGDSESAGGPESAGGSGKNPLEIKPLKQEIPIMTSGIRAQFKQSGESERFVFYNSNPEAEALQQEYIDNGLLFHSIFEDITTEESVDACVDQKLSEGLIESQEKATQIKELIHSYIKRSGHASDWFGGEFRLYNEMSILCKQEQSATSRRPDRVMVSPDGRVTVIDYKFGKTDENHMRQVQNYMNLLRDMGYRNVQGYIWYVLMNKVIYC